MQQFLACMEKHRPPSRSQVSVHVDDVKLLPGPNLVLALLLCFSRSQRVPLFSPCFSLDYDDYEDFDSSFENELAALAQYQQEQFLSAMQFTSLAVDGKSNRSNSLNRDAGCPFSSVSRNALTFIPDSSPFWNVICIADDRIRR